MLIAGAVVVGFAIAFLTDIERESGNRTGRKAMWIILWLGFASVLLSASQSFWAVVAAAVGAFAGWGSRRWLRKGAQTTRSDGF